jgi:hypothetical protein
VSRNPYKRRSSTSPHLSRRVLVEVDSDIIRPWFLTHRGLDPEPCAPMIQLSLCPSIHVVRKVRYKLPNSEKTGAQQCLSVYLLQTDRRCVGYKDFLIISDLF